MIVRKKNRLIDETKLEGEEIPIFKEFLLMEKARHIQDIKDIERTIQNLKPKKSDNSSSKKDCCKYCGTPTDSPNYAYHVCTGRKDKCSPS